METKELNLTEFFQAEPQVIFELFMDQEKQSKYTETKCTVGREAGEEFSCYDGWVLGKNVVIVQDEKIIQEWRSNDWVEGHYSNLTIELIPKNNGTELLLSQTEIPADKIEDITKGWKSHYFDKMKKYLNEN
jgi:activator of HSP90 ATPase